MDTEGQEWQYKGTDMAPDVSTPADDGSLPLGLIPGCLTVDQAAAKAGVTTKTIRRWLDSGALPSQMVRRGKARVLQISPADLEEAVRASGRRKIKSKAQAINEDARIQQEAELAMIRQELSLERGMRLQEAEERAKLTAEAEAIRKQAEEQRAEDLRQREEDQATQKSQAEAVRLALAEVRQALYESKSEAHELKAQLSMLQDQVLRALPLLTNEVAKPETIWQKIGRVFGIGRK